MKYLHYLALVGALGSADALQLQAQNDTCEATLNVCTAANEKAMFFRKKITEHRGWKRAYAEWWAKRDEGQSLAQVQNEDCQSQLEACQADKEKLQNFFDFLEGHDKKYSRYVQRDWNRYMNIKNRWTNIERANEKFIEKNPLVERDGALSESSETESESDNNDDERNNNGLPEITQSKVQKTCTGSFDRLVRESKGKVTPTPGTPWKDQSFPADGTSLDWTRADNRGWYRISEQETSPSLYGLKGANPGAARQGGLGNCWFIATMSAIGEYPDVVKKIFRGAESYPTNGQVVVDMHLYGKPHRVMIDDQLPKGFSRKGPNGAWWGPLLEKAAAKYWGYYKRMNGGWMGDAFNVLVNQPGDSFSNARYTVDELWDKLHAYDQKNVIMTSDTNNKAADTFGLVKIHAYTTIGTTVYTDPNGAKHRLVKMRNPWSSEVYHGPWSDKSDEMTEHAMKALNHVNAKDGVFFTPIETYHTIVRANSVVRYDKDFKRSQRMAAIDRSAGFRDLKWSFNNPVSQKVAIATSAPRPRVFSKNDCNTRLQSDWINFNIRNSQGTVQTSIRTDRQGSLNEWFEFDNLPAGEYEIFVQGTPRRHRKDVMDFGLVGLATTKEIVWAE